MKKGFIWFVTFILVAVAAFLIISLCLASNHGKTLTEEWESWKIEKVEEKTDKDVESDADNTATDGVVSDQGFVVDPIL